MRTLQALLQSLAVEHKRKRRARRTESLARVLESKERNHG